MSTYKEVPHDSIYLEFPSGKSDGNPAKWPTNKLDQSPNAEDEVNFMRPIELDEPLCIKWRTQVGHGVAKLMGHTNHTKYVLKDFPEGYKFYHHNKGNVHDPRTDPYLYGSASGRYRSPQEFIPHAFWLMTDDNLQRKNCRCKYCTTSKTQKQISQELGLTSVAIPGSSTTRAKPKIRPVTLPRKSPSRSVVSHDRTADLRSNRRFRAGELVWCALSPAIHGSHRDECIEFWPGLVNETRLKNEVTPHAPSEPWSVVQSIVYKVKLLAVNHSCVLSEAAILPYQAYCPSLNLIEPLRNAGDPALLQDLDRLSQFNPVLPSPEPTGSLQSRFVEASTPFALAIQIAAHLVRLWTPSDEWIFHGETSIPRATLIPPATQPTNSPAVVSNTESRYQGLWWGAERIWVEELVRLQPGRSQVVPQGSQAIYRASPRAEGRGVLLRINSIFVEPRGASKDAIRECKVAGTLYELAEDTYEVVTTNPSSTDPPVSDSASLSKSLASETSFAVGPVDTSLTSEKGARSPFQNSVVQNPPSSLRSPCGPINLPNFPAYQLADPPLGYKFRQITKPGFEIVLDVSLIAGRYYPGLLKHPLLQDALVEVDMNESRIAQLSALCGLLAGAINSMECLDWVGTRLAMVKLSDVKAQQDLHQHWHTSSTEEQLKSDDVMNVALNPTELKDSDIKDHNQSLP